jgi:hypothetical protein
MSGPAGSNTVERILPNSVALVATGGLCARVSFERLPNR